MITSNNIDCELRATLGRDGRYWLLFCFNNGTKHKNYTTLL